MRMKQAQKFVHFGSWELDLSTGIGIWSEEACRIYGLAPEDNKHSFEDWMSYIHPDDVSYVLKIMKRNESELGNTDFSHRIIMQNDGTVRHVRSLTAYDDDIIGKPVCLLGMVYDITEQKVKTQQLEEQNEQLRQIAWLQSHKVRGPLATILGLAMCFKSNKSDLDVNNHSDLDVNEIINGILVSSEKLDKVIREIVNKTSTQIIQYEEHNSQPRIA